MPAVAIGAIVVGGLVKANQQRKAASEAADAQMRAAEMQAAEDERARREARFHPIGVTNRFGSSNFQFDSEGRLTGGGYTLSPELLSAQNQLMGMTPGLLAQYSRSQQATAPMGQAAQSMFSLGNQYLATDPLSQAQKYMADMQATVAAPRAKQLADIRERLNATGRTGLAIGGGEGMTASNPEMAAYYNALVQQDRDMAAQATQGGMDYAKFGASLSGLGGGMLRDMYGTQSAAYQPYATALQGANTLEQLGQNTFDMGMQMGKTSQVGYNPSTAMSQGVLGAGTTLSRAQGPDWGGMMQQIGSGYMGSGGWGQLGNMMNRQGGAPVEDRQSPGPGGVTSGWR